MEIIKLVKYNDGHYSAIFDELPALTYEKIGADYVGSYVENGVVIFSLHLKMERWGDAFAGRELTLRMKDGSTEKIKDYWFDAGSYANHGEFTHIGAGTLEELQACYVYFSRNINTQALNRMVSEYLKRDRIYEHRELEKWCKLQYEFYPIVISGKEIPYMMNKYGDIYERESKKRVYGGRSNRIKKVNGKWKEYIYFIFSYMHDDTLIKIERKYIDVLKATLPFAEQEIIKNCNLKKIF